MEIKTLETLIRIRDLGSFAAVAREQDADPSTLSRLVSQAEDDLGMRLFQRSTRSLSVSPDGAAYLDRIEPLIEELRDASESARRSKSAPSGTLRIGCSVAFGTLRLAPLLPAFRDAFPEITLDLVLEDKSSDLVSAGLDLALRLAPEVHGDLICARLASTSYHVCATPEVAKALPTPSHLAETEVLRQNLPGYRDAWIIKAPHGTATRQPIQGPVLISSPLALLEAACQGVGAALLADWVSDAAVREGRLVRLWEDHAVTATNFDTALWLLYSSRAYLPARTRAGIDFLREHLAR
ncbi:MAG: LysR family transcriptional regulator [Pseudomonadota bacterium]